MAVARRLFAGTSRRINRKLPDSALFPRDALPVRIALTFLDLRNTLRLFMARLSSRPAPRKAQAAAAGQIRIIGGQWRGRKLPVPNSAGLRPTTDRVRETLFNWLAPVIQGARCLDCFAGSGALGLEALSRYAGSATLLEFERPVAQQLEKSGAA